MSGGNNRMLVGDVRAVLDELPDSSVDTVITSPPYFRLRNYQQEAQIGLEPHVDDWVNELLLVARGLKRVLKSTGSLWLNLGDTFSRHPGDGASPKSLVLAPERLALAMINDGWILRSKVIWAKPNPMPTSVRDRLSCTWEVVYFFVKSREYYFDLDAIRVPHRGRRTKGHSQRAAWSVPDDWRGPSSGTNSGLDRLKASGLPGHPLGKNPGDVWTIPTAGYRGAHHAVFPERLVRVPLLATCPKKVCAECGVPWVRDAYKTADPVVIGRPSELRLRCSCSLTTGYQPGVVVDPFMGSGTTAIVAERHGREWLGIELNPDFAALAMERITRARTLTTEDPDDEEAAA
jgi:site-specific DNA-methyltransferase (adenine-specific)